MKRKFRPKWIIAILTAIIFIIASICIIINLRPVTVDYGSSEIYSKQDIDDAVEIIKDNMNLRTGCKLFSLTYKGDERCRRELDYCNSLSQDGELFTECIVIGSCFRSPIFGGGGWNAISLYYWDWYLARTENGSWQLLTQGYA